MRSSAVGRAQPTGVLELLQPHEERAGVGTPIEVAHLLLASHVVDDVDRELGLLFLVCWQLRAEQGEVDLPTQGAQNDRGGQQQG